MERAALLSRGELILLEHLPTRLRPPPRAILAPESAEEKPLGEIENTAIMEALRKHHFNRTETAKALGISRRTLIYKLQRLREAGFAIGPVDSTGG